MLSAVNAKDERIFGTQVPLYTPYTPYTRLTLATLLLSLCPLHFALALGGDKLNLCPLTRHSTRAC